MQYFFPVCRGNHFYVVCFDLRVSRIEIIDHILHSRWRSLGKIYGEDVKLLRDNFVGFLEWLKFKKLKKIQKAEPKRILMPWRINKRTIDSAVFVIRHMESYTGGGWSNWDAGFARGDENVSVIKYCYGNQYEINLMLVIFFSSNLDSIMNNNMNSCKL